MEVINNIYLASTTSLILINIAIGIVFFILSVLIDSLKQGSFRRVDTRAPSWYPRYLDADNDVLREAQAIEVDAANNSLYSVKVKNLQKVYGNGYPAVGGVSFGIQKNEVVGLLGPNGAGKSTTFSVLTMDNSKNSGEVNILGIPIDHFDNQVNGKFLGLAAQSNVIWDTLTVDEHLQFIANIKGLDPVETQFQIQFIKNTLDLTPFGDKQASQLSGGNKRKLCCAISLIANPQIEFLDEPTTGVDPIARRSLFKMLK